MGMNVINAGNECEFKRGGRCIKHGVVGEKIVKKERLWTKLKGGLHGWVTKQKTSYTCKLGGSDQDMIKGQNKLISSSDDIALGEGDNVTQGLKSNQGISGAEIRGAGSKSDELIGT